MIHVVLPADLPFTGGITRVEVQAATLKGLMLALEQRFPGLGEHLDSKMAFAVNGEIHQDAWFAPLDEGAEVVVLPKIGGG